MESFGACKQVDPLSASDARYQIILEDTAYNDGCRYQLGMLWPDKRSSLPKKLLVRTVKILGTPSRWERQKELSYAPTITGVWDKSYNLKIDKNDCFKADCLRKWYYLSTPLSTATGRFWQIEKEQSYFRPSSIRTRKTKNNSNYWKCRWKSINFRVAHE